MNLGACHANLSQPGLQSDLVVRPDPIAQIIKQFDDRQRLIGRPARIDEQVETVVQTGRLMNVVHVAAFAERFLDLAAACSCASLRR